MRDAAGTTAHAGPVGNGRFSRLWAEPPPQKRRRPALGGASNRAYRINSTNSNEVHPTPEITTRQTVYAVLEHLALSAAEVAP
jgi:hypothetical protein